MNRAGNRILILNTGGTFCMRQGPEGLVPEAGLGARLDTVLPELGIQIDVIELEPLIDSSNLLPSHWQRIARLLFDNAGIYKGIVIIHGTDTLAYTASALSFICGGLNAPIVVTGSQKPLEQPGSDAPINFSASIELINSAPSAGVYVCFGGYVLQGNRCRKVAVQSYQGFDSPNAARLGLSEPSLRLVQGAAPFTGSALERVPQFDDAAVATLLVYPGMIAAQVEALINRNTRAMILLSYGSGNLPSANAELVRALECATERGVLLVNLTQCAVGYVEQGVYQTGSLLQRLGALDGFDLTPEAAYARIHYLLATCSDKKAVEAAWPQPLCGEFSLLS